MKRSRIAGTRMMVRRTAITTLIAVCAGALSACGFGDNFADGAREAIEAVDGVSSTELRFGSGGTFQTIASGTISIEAETDSGCHEIFDHAIGALVRYAMAEEKAGMEIDGISGICGNLRVSVGDLMPGEDRITVGMLADRY